MGTEYQIESGVCNGRGFSHVDATGYCKLFKDWIVKAVADGGPAWYLLDDQSSTQRDPVAGDLTNSGLGNYTAAQCVDNDVTTKAFDMDSASGGEYLNIDYGVGVTREIVKWRVFMDAAGSTSSWSVKYSDDDITYSDAETGLVPAIAGWNFFEWASAGAHRYWRLYLENAPGAGADVMEFELYDDTIVTDPYIVVSDQQNPAPNDRGMVVKVGYLASEAGYVRVQYLMYWNQMTHTGQGYWAGNRLQTLDSSDFAYDFRGGEETSDHRCLLLRSRNGSNRYHTMIDGWTGNTTFVEAPTVIGTLQSGITAGSSVVLQLDTGEAALFTANKWYYIMDFTDHTWCDYVQCTAVNTGTDQITVDALETNFPAGTIIGAYPHRFYNSGNNNPGGTNMSGGGGISKIPYMSYASATYAMPAQNTTLHGFVQCDIALNALKGLIPDDDGAYAVQKPFIVEYQNTANGQTQMNRAYGCCNNLYTTWVGSMVLDLDGITIGANNWLYCIGLDSAIVNGNGNYAALFLDTEAAT